VLYDIPSALALSSLFLLMSRIQIPLFLGGC